MLDAKKIIEAQKEYLDSEYIQKWSERLGLV